MQKISLFPCGGIFFMAMYDEIEFLDSEILDDDANAPVGTLIHVLDDGTVEEVPVSHDIVSPVEDNSKPEENKDGNADQDEKAEDTPLADPISDADVAASDNADEIEPEDATVSAEKEPEDTTDSAENAAEDTTEQADTQTVQDASQAEVNEPLQEELPLEEPVQEVAQEPTQEPIREETADETEQDVRQDEKQYEPVPVIQADMSEPQVETEQVQEDLVEKEPAQATEQKEEIADTAVEDKLKEPKAQKPKKARKPAQKKPEEAPKTEHEEKSEVSLDSAYSVGGALHDTDFVVETPKKAKIVSTKQKQEKAEDLWAVASVVPKKKAVKDEEKQEEMPKKKTAKALKQDDATEQVAADTSKKSAAKKSTKVENTSNSTTEAKKKVAAKDKAATTAEKDVKATKTTAKTAAKPAKEETKAPEKEVNATKAAKPETTDEQVLQEGEGKTHGKYVIKKTDKGNFVFKLYSSNYRVVAIGAQAYTTLGAAKIGVQSVINNAEIAPVENQTLKNYETLKFPKWEIYLDKKGEYRLRLFATNGNLIATTNDGYADISGAKNGITAVARASKGCAIVRNDNLW